MTSGLHLSIIQSVVMGILLLKALIGTDISWGQAKEAAPILSLTQLAGAEPPKANNKIPIPMAPAAVHRPAAPKAPAFIYPAPDKVKSILDLQVLRQTQTMSIDGGKGNPPCNITLSNLHPGVSLWYYLSIKCGAKLAEFHLEARSADTRISLEKAFPDGLTLFTGGTTSTCELWRPDAPSPLKTAIKESKAYVDICGGALYVRNQVEGNQSTKEQVVSILRDKVWGGEQITNFVKETVYKDSFYLSSNIEKADGVTRPAVSGNYPQEGRIDEKYVGSLVEPKDLGILVQDAKDKLEVGKWYQTRNAENVYVSAIEPGIVASDILSSHTKLVGPLDGKEDKALAYMVAFDLNRFDLSFALGTEHPRVEWSERTPSQLRNNKIPGPDGIGTIAPLVSTGSLPPHLAPHVVATFTGGFKRSHGAFKWGALSFLNSGSHYGFIENGVTFSRLQPGLATIVVYHDGNVDLKTWTEKDNEQLANVKHARQNGVPLLDFDPNTATVFPGALVRNWGQGNWSGSSEQKLRSLRAGVCLQEKGDQKFLIYGYFSSVTPSAMVRVFQAYQCKYAFHLDMNALEHTYMALYPPRSANSFKVEHLIQGMDVLDKKLKGEVVPRFLGFPDNRDFFYLVPKNAAAN